MNTAPIRSDRLAIFTICSNNYMPFANVLMASLSRYHPEAELFLCLADRLVEIPGLYGANWTVIEAQALPIPDFHSFAFRYDIMEFNTALKPFMFLHLLDELAFDTVIYFDPDIELFAPLTQVLATLRGSASFLLTPHLCAPSEARQEPNDLTIMRAGAYNLGFLGVSRSELTSELIAWWARRLRYYCVNAQAEGIFVDQKFMDLIPSFAETAVVTHDTTLNVAYWNLAQRELSHGPVGWTVDGAPLTFFHFSGFNPATVNRLSKHDPRFVDNLSPPLQALTTHYAERLLAAGYGIFSGAHYAYGRFASDNAVHPVIRTMFRTWHPYWGGNPFDEYEAFLHAPWPEAASRGPGIVVTNFMRFLQGIVPHLSNLDLRTPADTKQLVSWFINDASESLTLDPALIQPAAARLGEGRTSCAAIATRPADQEIKVAVIAPLRAISEVEASGRMTFAALLASGVAVEMWETSDPDQADQAPVHIICMSDDQMAGKSRPALAARSDVVRILVPIGHLARFPDAAMPALSLVDEVWAPSRFIQLALAARTNSPVIHMPLAVEVGPVVPMARDRLGLPEDRFTFLSVFDGRPNLDRTNACSAIRAFRQAFPQRGRACLVLASGPRSLTSEERAILDAAIDGNGDIRVLDQPLNYGAMSNLIAACDAMLSLHRSEGLGLAIAHAMLRRRPVIAPRYAATGEYVTSSTGYPVDYLLVPAVDGGCWADVDTSHAAWIMARLVNEPQGAAMLIDKAYDYVEQQHSRKNVAARLKARLATLAVRR